MKLGFRKLRSGPSAPEASPPVSPQGPVAGESDLFVGRITPNVTTQDYAREPIVARNSNVRIKRHFLARNNTRVVADVPEDYSVSEAMIAGELTQASGNGNSLHDVFYRLRTRLVPQLCEFHIYSVPVEMQTDYDPRVMLNHVRVTDQRTIITLSGHGDARELLRAALLNIENEGVANS